MKQQQLKQPHNYHVLAKYYDRLMSAQRYKTWEKMIKQIVKKYKVPINGALDIACGTGTISNILYKQGFDVIGIDKSSAMLKIAREKVPEANFVCTDVRNFTLKQINKPVFAVSFYDSLNYLLSKDQLLKAFKTINRNLAPGAIFIFDINTKEHVKHASLFAPSVFEDENVFIVFRYSKEKQFWKLVIDFFTKDSNPAHLKEIHLERGYNESDVLPLLKKSGFELLSVEKEYKVGADDNKYLSRLYFITGKK